MPNLDDKPKRFSGVHVSLPFGRFLIDADGSMDQGDRQHLPYYYSGILAGAAVLPTGQIPKVYPVQKVVPLSGARPV